MEMESLRSELLAHKLLSHRLIHCNESESMFVVNLTLVQLR